MIYLSHLLIDTGGDPDRPRPGRMWLDNIYNVHRRLSMAFPSNQRKRSDPEFLQPFAPQDFQPRQFLFRVDNNIDGSETRAVIIVQSSLQPDWDYCFQNARDFLAAPVETKIYDPHFAPGDILRFRIRLNASRKTKKYRTAKKNDKGKEVIQSKRVSLTWEASSSPDQALSDWFAAKSAKLGFTPQSTELIQLGWVYGSKPVPFVVQEEPEKNLVWRDYDYKPMRFRSALLEGILRVEDPPLFLRTLHSGIGSAKGMGFGLLSVAPGHA